MASLIGAAKVAVAGTDCRKVDPLMKVWTKNPAASGSADDVERITHNNRTYEVSIIAVPGHGPERPSRILLRDITGFVKLEKELLKRNKELIVINSLSSAFISSENIDLVLEDIIDKVLLISDFHTGWLLLNEDGRYRLRASRGIPSGMQRHIDEGALDGLCEEACRSGEPIYLVEGRTLRTHFLLREEGVVFLAIVPLLAEKAHSGLLFLASRAGRDFDFDFAALLSLIGNHVSHIVEKIRLFQETRRLSVTDGLTGLYNTRFFYKSLEAEIARTRRYGSTFSLIIFDIDDFKVLNDTYGHQAGDEVLQDLAKILTSVSRQTDVVVRYGGEEFVIILPNTTEDETDHLANRIRRMVQDTVFGVSTSSVKIRITLSGGIASFPQNAGSAKTLLNAADTALYAAKAAGKNTVIRYQGIINETDR
ncbi:MAG: sensor domain-containing diguanylate cyclase [Thermodesulfovibrionales bacterium]